MTLAELQALVAKKEAARAAVKKRMADALAASEKDGVSAEDKAKHLADFDAAEAELPGVEKELARATALRDAEQRADAHDRREGEPARARLAAGVTDPTRSGRPAGVVRTRRDRNFALASSRLASFRGEDARERAYQTGLWVAATMFGNDSARNEYESNYGEIQAAMNTADNAKGGYFVPEVIETSVIELVEDFGVFRRYADVVPMSSDSQTEPRWTGGLTAYFVAEGSAPNQSDPSWDKITLSPKNLAAYGKMSRNLNEDAIINLGDKWAMAAAIAFAEKEDDCGFNGTGASAYGGMTGLLVHLVAAANAASLVTATGETTLAALTVGTIDRFMGALPQYAGIRPAFFMHKSVYHASIGRLKNTAGGVTAAELTAGSPPQYGGYPVVFAQKMPAAASVTTGVTGIIFGDLSLSSKFGDRRGRTFEVGMDGNDFSQQLMSLLCTERFDIVNHTITDPRNSSNAGPVLGLKLG